MSEKLNRIIKHNQGIYKIIFFVGKAAMNILSLFVKPDDKLILFNSFGGKKYDDSPKAIYEQMLRDYRFNEYKLVWAFHNPNKFPNVQNKIKTDNMQYFIMALKARCWVTNSSIQRGMDFKGKKTYSFNTWHGTPIKKMGVDTKKKFSNNIIRNCDVILAQSQYEVNKMAHAWMLPKEQFKILGLPRNDALTMCTAEDKKAMRMKLRLPLDKKVILYAPTFRDYQLNQISQVTMSIPINYQDWEKRLGNGWAFVLRAHYEVAKCAKLPQSSMWFDFSGYESLNELMIASDILISDYSSIIFDYSILKQPMLGFTYDFDEYQEKRGMYFDIRNEISCYKNDKELVNAIVTLDEKKEKNKCIAFRKKYVTECGHAAQKSCDWIYSVLKGE